MVLSTEWSQVEVIELRNDGSGLGFGIVGGRSTGVVVKSILPGGIADKDNRLQSGDHIIQIGDVNLRGFSAEQVASVLRSAGLEVRMVVARPIESTSEHFKHRCEGEDDEFADRLTSIVPTKILTDPEEIERLLISNGYQDYDNVVENEITEDSFIVNGSCDSLEDNTTSNIDYGSSLNDPATALFNPNVIYNTTQPNTNVNLKTPCAAPVNYPCTHSLSEAQVNYPCTHSSSDARVNYPCTHSSSAVQVDYLCTHTSSQFVTTINTPFNVSTNPTIDTICPNAIPICKNAPSSCTNLSSNHKPHRLSTFSDTDITAKSFEDTKKRHSDFNPESCAGSSFRSAQNFNPQPCKHSHSEHNRNLNFTPDPSFKQSSPPSDDAVSTFEVDIDIEYTLPETERFTILLNKTEYGLGITIAGYVCEREDLSGIFVKSISEGSEAHKCGRIDVNDRIVEVDGESLQDCSNHEAVEKLKKSGTEVRLTFERYLRGPKFEHLQEALAVTKEVQKDLSPPSPSVTTLSWIPIDTEPQIEPEGESCTTINSEVYYEPPESKEIFVEDNFRSEPSPDCESVIKRKWSTIIGEEAEIVVAHLTKLTGLGISLEGTVDVEAGVEVRPHHYIRSILPEGPVGQNGRLNSGDELLEVNGQKLLGIKHVEVVKILKDLPSTVRLVCARKHEENRVINTSQDREAFEARNIVGGSLKNLLNGSQKEEGKRQPIGGGVKAEAETGESIQQERLLKALGDSLETGESIQQERLLKAFSDSLETGELFQQKKLLKALSDSLETGESIQQKKILKALSESLETSESIQQKKLLKSLSDSLETSESIQQKKLLKAFSDSLETGESIQQKKLLKTLSDTFETSESLQQNRLLKALSDSLETGESLQEKKLLKTLSDTLETGESPQQERLPESQLDQQQNRLLKALSDTSINTSSTATITDENSLSNLNKAKSRSLENTNLAMWGDDVEYIDLVKTDRGLGFSILDYQDPVDAKSTVIVIRSLVPNGAAETDGRLRPGDRLVSVNDNSVKNSTLDQAVQVLKGAQMGVVKLGVARPLTPVVRDGSTGSSPTIGS